MPAIRGYTFSYETTTTDAGLVIPECESQQGDLLIAICMADTGALTTFTATPPSGWSILQEWLNTTPMIAYFKIASASESDLTIAATTHATTNETYNGSMVSIRDVDQATPIGVSDLSSYATANQDSLQALGDGTTAGVGQSFTTPAGTANTNGRGCLARVRFYLKKSGSPSGNIVAKIYAHSGTLGTSSVPTGAALATSDNVSAASLTGSLALVDFVFSSGNWFQFVANTSYVITIEYSGGDPSNFVQVGYDASAPGHAGNMSTFAGSWAAQAGQDACFFAQRFTLNTSSMSAAARTNMPTISTERDQSLVLYLGGGSGSAGTPSFIDGTVQQILGGDGAAESHGLGWNWQRVAGTTSNNVYCTMAVTGASVKGIACVNPPASGATVVPPHVVSDACTYVDPIQGTSAFNGNAALAATADTNFGTSIGGLTANDATVAAITDVGINSFHSMGGLTNAAAAGTISGAEVVLAAANRVNMTSKNLLCHVRASTPAHLQRYPNVASTRGSWMGVRSNTGSGGTTTGYKIWQVHAVDTSWLSGAYVPIVINVGNPSTRATSGTLDAAVVTSVGFWTSGIGALTAQMGFGQLWLMDTTIVAGGTASEPIGIGGIVRAVAVDKERVSAIQQGAKQMLLLQDVQIGDGTDPVYLLLDATAIEFPRQYSSSTREINYCSIDNKIGLKYRAASGDTIVHRNSLISSPSRYFWGLHASSSASATYDFAALTVLGAGAITLALAITITGLTINDYSTIDASGLNLDLSTIKGCPSASASITTTTGTLIEHSILDVSGVGSGNWWCSMTTPVIFENNAFVGGGGHAIRITSAGTYTFIGNTFAGFGADGSNGAAIFNDSGGAVTINVTGGGSTPTVRNGSGASTTINNNRTVTLTGLKNPSEVRVFSAGTQTEIAGQENVTTGTFAFSVGSGVSIDVSILALGYQNMRLLAYSTTSDATIPVSQVIDRQYANP